MRSLLLVLVVLAAVGGLTWYLLSPDAGGGTVEYGDTGLDAGEEAAGPGLTAAGSQRAAAPDVTSGTGWIQGIVTRGGDATAAVVELRHLAEIDPRNPYGTGIEMQMIARMLDSGVSTKPILMKTRAGDAGRFRFKGLATGRYEVRATTAAGAMGFSSASLPARGAHVEAAIKIPVGDGTLEGRVVYADGKPFQGLVVATTGDMFAMMMGGGGDVRPTQTDADGRFAFAGLVTGKTSLSAVIPGRMRVMGPPVVVPHEGEYVLTIDAGGRIVQGLVIRAADESPIAGATVFGGGGNPASSFAIRSTLTDADGRFRLPVPDGQGSGVLVQADGFRSAQINSLAGSQEDLVIPLVAMGRITGRVVVKENGTPASDVTVIVKGERGGGGMPNLSSTVTDADGRYVLDNVAPGLASLHALGSGWISEGYGGEQNTDESPYAAEVEPGGSHEVNIQVTPGARAGGTLKTSSGEPVVGAVVHAGAQRGRNDMFVAMFGGSASFGAVVSDEEGRFEIDVLAPGASYKITAKAPEHPDAVSEMFTAVAGKTQNIDLIMAAPRYLQVLVVAAESGTPVAGAQVMLQQGEGGTQEFLMVMGGRGPRTDQKGRARLGPLGTGEMKVTVSVPGHVTRRDVSVEDDGSDTIAVTVEVTRGLIVAGTVLVPVGVPVQSVRVTISRSSNSGGRWFHENPSVSAAGAFRVDTIESPGLYEVKGELTWEERTFKGQVDVDAGTVDVRLELTEMDRAEAGVLVVTVVDAAGKAVPSARVRLRRVADSGRRSWSRGLNGGRVTFRDVGSDAEFWIEVHELIGDRGAVIQGPLRAADGQLEIRLPVAKAITGRVVGPDGGAVRGVRVSARAVHPAEDVPRGQVHGKALSNAAGDFTIKGLGDLSYELELKVPADFIAPEKQTVRSGTKGVSLRLGAGLAATLTVLDASGKPVAGAYAHATPQETGSVRGNPGRGTPPRSAQDGRLKLRGLDPAGVFTLRVSPPRDRKDLKARTIKDWKVSDETIRLAQAWRIEGHVRDQKGRPAASVWVRARVEGTEKWVHSTNADDEGSFVLRELDAGRYEVRVDGVGGRRMSSPAMPATPNAANAGKDTVTVRAGTKGVALTVDVGEKLVVRVLGMKSPGRSASSAALHGTGPQSSVTISGTWEGTDRVVFTGLESGRSYELWIAGLPGNTYVFKEAVSDQTEVLEVTPKAGLALQGHTSLPAGMPHKRVSVSARTSKGIHVRGKTDLKTGQFRLEGLPPGPCTVYAYTWHDGTSLQASTQASAGDSGLELSLKKRP